MDGRPDPEASPKARLVYPFAGPPARGQTTEVAPGVHWIRMPLPYALNHINLWALDDGDGWALVDTGVRTEDTALVWRELFANAPDERSLSRVIVTHMHPDHVGMAGWLTRKFGVRLWMTALEYLSCRAMVSDTGREAPPDAIDFYRRAGWGPAAIEAYTARFGNFGKHIHPLPDSFRRLDDGDELAIGRHVWRVIVGTGHSPAHACLYCPALKLLISGDQVLPRISSNVSVYPTEPDADPMRGWLESLARIRREVPDDVLVLPAHNECFPRPACTHRRPGRRPAACAGPAAAHAARAQAGHRCLRRLVRPPHRRGRHAAAGHGHGREPGLPELSGASW